MPFHWERRARVLSRDILRLGNSHSYLTISSNNNLVSVSAPSRPVEPTSADQHLVMMPGVILQAHRNQRTDPGRYPYKTGWNGG